MTARLVQLGGVQVQEGGVDVVFGDDAPAPSLAEQLGFILYRNGDEAPFEWDTHQLSSISLAMAALDASVGMGSVTVPGDPGWLAGDRITFTDHLGHIIYTGYVGDHTRQINPAQPTEVECTYSLMDLNRQLIGRKVVDWVRPDENSYDRLTAFISDFLSDIDLDLTYVDPWAAMDMEAKTYTGDGITDLAADLILLTGRTIFLVPTQTENRFELHYHDVLTAPVTAGLSVSDQIADVDNVNVFALTGPQAHFAAADMKNDVTGRNGTTSFSGTNALSMTRHNAGGLKFESVLDYSTDEVALFGTVANLLNAATGAGEEKITYSGSIEKLTATNLIRIPPGSGLVTDSMVLQDSDGVLRISVPRIGLETLTVHHDVGGNPLPGYWDVALELAYPLRIPVAVRGYGGQGGSLGALSEDFSIADHINVYQPDQLPPVGESMIVSGQVVDRIERAIKNNPGVTVNWTLNQWQDDAGTIPSTAWSLDDTFSLTDAKGVALIILSHDNDDPWSWVYVHGELA